jgi:class 3 adenylate cyclase
LILFDKRGSGSSDNVSVDALATLEHWSDDVVTVLNAVGSQRAAVLAAIVGSPIALLFAATHPDRISVLVLVNAAARIPADSDYPGLSPESVEDRVAAFSRTWGTGATVDLLAPSMSSDEAFRSWFARFCRVGNPPGMATAVFRAQLATDVRSALPLVQAPTLVIQRADVDVVATAAQGRYIAEHIPGARYVELPGRDPLPYVGDAVAVLEEIEEFLTGERSHMSTDRVLATVLFTDIVASTEQLATVGDDVWRHVLDDHDRTMSHLVDDYRGRVVRSTGDGILATFDGPARAVRCAAALLEAARAQGITLRAGLHTGEIELRPPDVAGIAVHIASRVASLAEGNEILVSRTVVDLTAGSGLDFEARGEERLKGVPGTWPIFAARDCG